MTSTTQAADPAKVEDYTRFQVNGKHSLKSMLRAIRDEFPGFPEKKAQMIERLQEYDRRHPLNPAYTLTPPPLRGRTRKGSNTPAPEQAPTVPAQDPTTSPRTSRKRKESPAAHSEPQTKRARRGGKGALEESDVGIDRDEDALMADADDLGMSDVHTKDRSHNTALHTIEEEYEEDAPHEGSRRAAREDSRNIPGWAIVMQTNTENSRTRPEGAARSSRTQRGVSVPREIDERFANATARAFSGILSRQQAQAQPVSSKQVPLKNVSNRSAAPGKARACKKPAMDGKADDPTSRHGETAEHQFDVDPDTAIPSIENPATNKQTAKGKEKAVPSPEEDLEEPVARSVIGDNNGNTHTGVPSAAGDEEDVDAAPAAEPVETEAEKRERELHERRELGGYADPEVASHWRQTRKTVLAPIDNYHHPKLPRAADDLIGYRRQIERAREYAEKNDEPIPLQDCKSPPRKLDNLRDYVHYPR